MAQNVLTINLGISFMLQQIIDMATSSDWAWFVSCTTFVAVTKQVFASLTALFERTSLKANIKLCPKCKQVEVE